MERRIGFVLVAVLLALAVLQPVQAARTDIAYLLEISGTSFLPSTIYAGDVVSLAVDIENEGSFLSALDVEGMLEIGDQFEAVDLEDTTSKIDHGTTKTFIFKFRVNEDTLPGYYPVLVTVDYVREGTTQHITETLSVSVPISKSEKTLDVTIEPRVINPGNQTDIVFTLANVGGTSVSNISFSWEEENDLVLPVGSDNKRFLSLISANGEESLSYTVAADPNIEPGIYPLDVTMTFTDVDGIKTQSSQVGLIVGGETDFEVSAEMLSTGQLSISIANIGSNNANAVVVRIPTQQGISVSGSSTSILGNLNKGDFTLANFEVRSTGTADRQTTTGTVGWQTPTGGMTTTPQSAGRGLLIEIDYTDTTGVRQSVEKTIELNMVFSSAGSDTTGSTTSGQFARGSRQTNGSDSFFAWALLGAILVGAIAFNKFKAGNANWKKLAKRLAVAVVLFLAVIFLLGANQLGMWAAAIISVVLLAWFFRKSLALSPKPKK